MDYIREPQTPKVNTAFMQTIRIVCVPKPPPLPKDHSIDEEKGRPPTASSSTSSFTFQVPRKPRLAPLITHNRQSIARFNFGGQSPSEQSSPHPAKPLVFGLPREQFYAYFALSLLLFSISVTIGLVVLASTPAESFAARFAGLAVSSATLPNSTQQNVAVFVQDPSTNTFSIRVSPNINTLPFSAPQQLDLMTDEGSTPINNISLAATSFASPTGSTIYHQLFYILDRSISVMNLSCLTNSSSQCTFLTRAKISTSNNNHTIAPDSGLAAVYLGPESGKTWKVFYHNEEYEVSSLNYENGSWNPKGMIIGSEAAKGSSIAATTFKSNIAVLYIDQGTNMLTTTQNVNGAWIPPSSLTSLQPPSLTPISALSISYAPTTDTLLAYYKSTSTDTDRDSNIYQFIGRNASIPAFGAAISSDLTGRTTPGWRERPVVVMSAEDGRGGMVSLGSGERGLVFLGGGMGIWIEGEVDVGVFNSSRLVSEGAFQL